jgi:hypothetical protein
MIEKELSQFIQALRAQLFSDGVSISRFITEETYLGGKKFSYKDHEFQEYIAEVVEKSFGKVVSVAKLSQVGLSELFNRIILAIAATRPGTGGIVSFPSKSFSQEVFKTRLSPIIDESPRLAALIDRNVDSASVKKFYNNSILYALGGNESTGSRNTLLNRPANLLLVDEFDRQSLAIITGYRSRMTHTVPSERLVLNISTPTVAGIGIDAEIAESYELHTPWILCECGHEFLGDYYKHIRIPDYEGDLRLLTKAAANKMRIQEAYLECPECKCKLYKHNKKTVWKVTYNDEGVRNKIGIVLDPFVAMGFLEIPDLVEASFTFSSSVEFLNQGLGKVADLKDSSIQRETIHFKHDNPPGLDIFGLDMGKMCHYMRGKLKYDTTIHVCDYQVVHLPEVEDFLASEFKSHYFAAGVVDSMPYADLIYRLVKLYPRLYSAIYTDPVTPRPDMFTLTMTDKYEELVRQVAINKNMAMNTFANDLDYLYTFEPLTSMDTMVQHFLDMRKVRDFNFEEVRYKWTKSAKGSDHFFHSAIYLFMASKLAMANLQHTFAVPIDIKAFRTNLAKK